MIPAARLLVWGAGGHASVVADTATAAGFELVGFVDEAPDRLGHPVSGFPRGVVAVDAELRAALRMAGGIPASATSIALGVGSNKARMEISDLIPPEMLPAILHPSATLSSIATVGSGTVLLPHSVVNARARIGRAAIINTGAIVEHDCELAHGVHVSPGAVLAGGCMVGACAWIGARAVVLPGLVIGANAVVGAGAVVTADVEPGVVVAGVPARQVPASA